VYSLQRTLDNVSTVIWLLRFSVTRTSGWVTLQGISALWPWFTINVSPLLLNTSFFPSVSANNNKKSINSISLELRLTVNVDVLLNSNFREWFKVALVRSRVFNLSLCHRQRRVDMRLSLCLVRESRVSYTFVSSFNLEIFQYKKLLEKGCPCLCRILSFHTAVSEESLGNVQIISVLWI
jgi:hypothetical protein